MASRHNFWLGMLIGAAVGAVGALMYAPKPGSEVRREVKARAKEAGRKAGEALSSVKESASDVVRSTREQAQQVISKGKEAIKSCRERLGESAEAGQYPTGEDVE